MMSKRIQRINQLIKKELSQIILREIEFSQGVLVTITRVETSPNLIESNVWISVLPEEKLKRILEILNKNIYFLQQKLNKRLTMRPIPRIKFLEERKTSEASRIEEILEELKKEEK
ncbi:MAG: ribosome-binding factor A [Candidatus Nealsonbacteria bacterium CG_4_10_14_0_2_um_filter_37_10]|uniref:Ribosome-binding factor A n=1 Tax=Candidatus Nealsonbacteria bacterium CG_4_10_14_0_2_um_filter_37_10 TaxID=1974679 RepID=A0A2M7V021_9BACT|nr:MAG: ribosome-binding factor A [Candidatus Nealsonbacteria bacterium CG_4_10_14_0_2_um_filter_37_10]